MEATVGDDEVAMVIIQYVVLMVVRACRGQ